MVGNAKFIVIYVTYDIVISNLNFLCMHQTARFRTASAIGDAVSVIFAARCIYFLSALLTTV